VTLEIWSTVRMVLMVNCTSQIQH